MKYEVYPQDLRVSQELLHSAKLQGAMMPSSVIDISYLVFMTHHLDILQVRRQGRLTHRFPVCNHGREWIASDRVARRK